MTNPERPDIDEGKKRYEQWRDRLLSDPHTREIYEEEAAKGELWLRLVEARKAAGLTQQQMAERIGVSQAQVARIEKAGYDAYTLNTLRKYVAALGEGFSLEVKIRIPQQSSESEELPENISL
jgi:DNA-binding XRE family transcriptional regulator